MSKTKKIIINIACGILLFGIGLGAGRGLRLASLSGVGERTESTVIELTDRATALESELSERIAECERLESESERIKSGVNECRGIVHQLRGDIDTAGLENQNALAYVKELRTRFANIEFRVRQLEEQLETIEGSTDKQ